MIGVLIVIFGLALIGFLMWYIYMYASQNWGDTVVALSFKEFYKYYQLNPDSWIVEKNWLAKRNRNLYPPIECGIKFTSYWRYLLFINGLQHERYTKKQDKAYIDLLQEVQKDIDDCRAKAKKYRDEGIDILKNL